MTRFLLPLADFCGSGRVSACRTGSQSQAGSFPTDRKTRARIPVAAIARVGTNTDVQGKSGQGMAAERVGVLVRFLPGGASVAG